MLFSSGAFHLRAVVVPFPPAKRGEVSPSAPRRAQALGGTYDNSGNGRSRAAYHPRGEKEIEEAVDQDEIVEEVAEEAPKKTVKKKVVVKKADE